MRYFFIYNNYESVYSKSVINRPILYNNIIAYNKTIINVKKILSRRSSEIQ